MMGRVGSVHSVDWVRGGFGFRDFGEAMGSDTYLPTRRWGKLSERLHEMRNPA